MPARTTSGTDVVDAVRRFLTDDTIEVSVRVAGLFATCFAQTLTRIVALQRADMQAYSIYAKPTRTTAMLDLASQLPPAILTDVLGMYANTAVRWEQAAGGDWATYATERATQAPT